LGNKYMATDSLSICDTGLPFEIDTYVDLLRGRARVRPQGRAFTFLLDGEDAEQTFTYEHLDRRARAIAARLRRLEAAGERALLVYEPGLEFIAAFFGCLYAGVTAVPVYPPDPMRAYRTLPRLQAIVKDAQARLVLTSTSVLSWGESLLNKIAGLEIVLATDEVNLSDAVDWQPLPITGHTVAFLQYTSGSTGLPKGVVLSHSNLLHNASQLHRLDDEDARGVLWAPPYHDMGLIGGILWPIYSGGEMVLMSPLSFVQRPFRWLKAISKYRASTSAAPNFAFDLCTRKISEEEKSQLDLSCWNVAINGAEPVRLDTIEDFVEAFGPCGFSRDAFYPSFGLAEATLIASGVERTSGPRVLTCDAQALENHRVEIVTPDAQGARTLVGCGPSLSDQRTAIVDPQTRLECSPGQVGEVWICGPSVAQGYWNQPELSREVFDARLADTDDGPFLRTGDFGFMHEGDIYITGRLKDLIIIHGRNLYPHDVEHTAQQSHPALKPDGGAAFSIDAGGEEQLVLVLEVLRPKKVDLDEVLQCVREALMTEYDLTPYAILLVSVTTVPKTSSGKTQRRACREQYLAGELTALIEWRADAACKSCNNAADPASSAPRTGAEEVLAALCSEVLGLQNVGRNENLFDLGCHSLLATQLVSRIREKFSVDLPLRALFEAPTVAELGVRVEAARAAGSGRGLAKIVPVARQGELELSFAQQRLWFLDQLEPGNPFYNLPVAARLQGQLDAPALQHSLDHLVRRHEALRTMFADVDGRPVQRIADELRVPLDLLDVSSVAGDEPENRVQGLLAEIASRPFDLAHGPLLRATLVKLAPHDHVLLLTMHHIVSDGWSMGVLLQELSHLYDAYRQGKPACLPGLSIQYADFAAWQRHWLQGDELNQQLAYWKERLGDGPAVLELPTDRPRPAQQTFHGAVQSVELSAELASGLRQVSRREGATLFMTVLAAFQTWLHRYTGQTDISVGCPIANRTQLELEGLIGFFVNTLVMRGDLSGDPTFKELLGRVRETTLGAYAHQDVPFEKLVEVLAPERSRSHAPLFQVALVLQNAPLSWPARQGEADGLRVSPWMVDNGTSKYDLTLFLWEENSQLLGAIEYNRDLFDASTIQRMWGVFTTMITGIVSDASQRLSQVPLLTADERQKLLVEWNATQQEYPVAQCFHDLFAAQAKRTPQSIAVVCGGRSLTYQELDVQSNRLAHYLRSLGVGPEVLVGVCLERSVDLLVSLLGVHKAGGAYVPLDPAYPRERLGFMLGDAKAAVLLTQRSLLGILPSHTAQVVCVDERTWNMAGHDDAPVSGVTPNHLAYVIYTSGSTGKPKGVQIPHQAMVNFLCSFRREPGMSATDVLLAVTTLSFDIAVLELFLPLMVGARVVIAPRDVASDGERLAAALADCSANVMQATPVTWRLLLAAGWQAPKGFRMLCGGEALDRELAGQLCAAEGELWNVYGPTETTVWSAVHKIHTAADSVSIGRPIANTQIYILDTHLQPTPIGVPGEMFIGGDGLARGYLHRADLTAERFVDHPFSENSGDRLYRTGDRVRYLANGNIEFQGRLDRQIKIRGFRVELPEIETILLQHPAVREAAVTVIGDVASGQRLAAYLAPRDDQPLDPREVKRYLGGKLPDYMIPAVFVLLEALPRTPNGKVDRNALPAPVAQTADSSIGEGAPRAGSEEVVAGLWAEVLHLERVGRNENFFDLGGHSLLATQLVSRIRQTLSIDLPLRTLFEAPTVAELAVRIEMARSTGLDRGRAKMEPVDRQGELELSFAQQRLWFLDQLEPGNPFYNLPVAARLQGQLDAPALQHSLDHLVRRHESLRTMFADVNGHPVQRIADELRVPLDLLDVSSVAGDEPENRVQGLLAEIASRPFDLAHGPLLRATLVKLAPHDHVLLLTMHHIVSDGWSMGVLLQELSHLYDAYRQGKPACLPGLSIQYADFAAWQRHWLQGNELNQQLAYWKERLGDGPAVLELPTDRPRPAQQTFHGAVQSVELSAELASGLRQVSRREGATLFMTVLAAFQTWLHRYTGQTDISVGCPIANRTQLELEGLIGFFVNTLVMRGDLSGDPTFKELLGRVRETTLGAYAHQDVPFEKLVEVLAPERSRSHAPLFQVALVLQNAPLSWPARQGEADGLRVSPWMVDNGTSKYDLTLFLWEENSQMLGAIEYNRDLFDASTIQRMWGVFTTLLSGIVSDASQRLSQVPLLTPDERQKLLVEWNAAQQEYPAAQCFHELFTEQAKRMPQSIAVVCGGRSLTYQELDVQSNRLAHYLRSLGVGPEVLVGVCLERSVDLLVSLLAVLKAGGAYVPLDPAYPRERLGFMLGDAKAAVLLTQRSLLGILPPHTAQVVCVDKRSWDIAGRDDVPVSGVTPNNLAYVIYTSGSTGIPKGVLLEHRGLSVRAKTLAKAFDVNSTSRVLQSASCSFDASLCEICMTWAAGGAVCMPKTPDEMLPGPGLARYLRDQRITTFTLPPAVLSVTPQEDLPALKTVVSVGEACSPEIVDRWAPGRRFINGYGPTEVTIGATMYECQPGQGKPLIGRPFEYMQVYILDRHLQPVPVGVPGEIHVGGIGLARGYLNRPELTAERFIANPFADQLVTRLYKTGDLGRLLPDGNLEFMGRGDQQIKIRGYRIELGEIESQLQTHPAVTQAVAIADRGETVGGQTPESRLIAYIVPAVDAADQGTCQDAQQERVAEWQTLFDETYQRASRAVTSEDATFNIIGWNSSYTGQPIPADEMRVWVDQTVARIQERKPARVLELGCGTGLLLFRLAPHCREYCGADFSPASLAYVRQQADARGMHNVKLFERSAEDATGFEPQSFDAVILNSVAQYFPTIDYLLEVLGGAVSLVRPGGFIFLGDIRNLALLEALHASVELSQAPDDLPVAQLQQRVIRRLEQEQELLVDPTFFMALKQRFAQLGQVKVQLKRGQFHNELSKFRYDVVLEVGTAVDIIPHGETQVSTLDWHDGKTNLPALQERLLENGPAQLRLRGVPNARVLSDVQAWRLLSAEDRVQTAGELRAAACASQTGVDPESFWALEQEVPYKVEIGWSETTADGSYDVLFTRHWSPADVPNNGKHEQNGHRQNGHYQNGHAQTNGHHALNGHLNNGHSRDGAHSEHAGLNAWQEEAWSRYANRPLRAMLTKRLAPAWKKYLEERLPAYMVPAEFIILDTLPLTAQGKVDRRALPRPSRSRPSWSGQYVAPRDEEECQMVKIWEEVLGLTGIGVTDNFFELGGHSMLAVRLIAEIERRCGRRLPLASLFQNATVEHMAAQLRQRGNVPRREAPVPIQPRGSKQPFFCVHPAGGTVFCYLELAAALGTDQPFYGLQARGLDGEQAPHETVQEMAASYIELMRQVQPTGPYLLGGWSLGGNLAYEMARQLEAQGERVEMLALFDAGAMPPDEPAAEEDFLPVIMGMFPEGPQVSLEELRQLPPAQQLEYFLERAQHALLVTPGDSQMQAQGVFDVFQANLRAMLAWRPAAYHGKVTLFRAEEQATKLADDATLGWDQFVPEVEVHAVPGDHVHMVRQPSVLALAERLRACLAESQARLRMHGAVR
jgi:amino acid adenylation domain-containing protein